MGLDVAVQPGPPLTVTVSKDGKPAELGTYLGVYARLGWTMLPTLDRVYANDLARRELGWRPRYHFAHVLQQLERGLEHGSELARAVGFKGYHAETFADGIYPVD